MTAENLTKDQKQCIVQFVVEAQKQVSIRDLKCLATHMYENALISDQFIFNPQENHSRFFEFKNLYNLLLKLEMIFDPEIQEVNLL